MLPQYTCKHNFVVCVLQWTHLDAVPSILSLQQHKKDFSDLAKNLTDIYLESSDEGVSANAALSLAFLARMWGKHLCRGCSPSFTTDGIVLERTSPGVVSRRTKEANGNKENVPWALSSVIEANALFGRFASMESSNQSEVESDSQDIEVTVSSSPSCLVRRCDPCDL